MNGCLSVYQSTEKIIHCRHILGTKTAEGESRTTFWSHLMKPLEYYFTIWVKVDYPVFTHLLKYDFASAILPKCYIFTLPVTS